MTPSQRVARWAAIGCAALVMLLTLWPLPEQAYQSSRLPVTCLVCGDQGLQDVFQNILMLLPLGLALGLAGVPPRRAALLGFALSLFVEAMQFGVITGRDASLSDLITNTTGTWLGARLAPHLGLLLRPVPQTARRLALGASVVWAVLWAFGAWAIGNDAGHGGWRGRFPGDLPDAPALNGEALSATVNGASLGVVPRALPASVEGEFVRGRLAIEGAVTVGPPIAWRENVITIIDIDSTRPEGNNQLVVVLNRVRKRALLSWRIKAADVLLRTPSFNLGPMFDARAGERIEFDIEREGGVLRAHSAGAGPAISTTYRLGPEMLYSIVAPRSPRPNLAWAVESLLWAAFLLVVTGYWAGRAGTWVPGAVAAVVVVAQVVVPWMFPVARQSALGWAMVLGGLILGIVWGRRSIVRA